MNNQMRRFFEGGGNACSSEGCTGLERGALKTAARGGLRLAQVLMASLWIASSVWAAPFAKRIPFVQPDGTAIELWGQGDEFYAVFETLDGYTVVYDQDRKSVV